MGRSIPLRTKTEHESRLEKLLRTPRLIGIEEPVVWSAKEIQIYRPKSIELATDIDVLFITDRRIIVGEYKCSPGNTHDVERQLQLAYRFVKDNFRVNPECLYICGPKFDYRRIL